jgi:hypothetical protein
MTGVARASGRSTPEARLRRATEALKADADVAHEWRDQDAAQVSAAVAEHLLVVAAALPSDVPDWLTDWQRLARRHGAIATPTIEEPTGGVDALIDLKVRLEEIAYRAEQSATREGPRR